MYCQPALARPYRVSRHCRRRGERADNGAQMSCAIVSHRYRVSRRCGRRGHCWFQNTAALIKILYSTSRTLMQYHSPASHAAVPTPCLSLPSVHSLSSCVCVRMCERVLVSRSTRHGNATGSANISQFPCWAAAWKSPRPAPATHTLAFRPEALRPHSGFQTPLLSDLMAAVSQAVRQAQREQEGARNRERGRVRA